MSPTGLITGTWPAGWGSSTTLRAALPDRALDRVLGRVSGLGS
jgi:hypothetical protein